MTEKEIRIEEMEVMVEIRDCCEEIGTLSGLIEDLSQVLLEMQDGEEKNSLKKELTDAWDRFDIYSQRLASARKRLEELKEL